MSERVYLAMTDCPDCQGHGYVPDVGGDIQACMECQAPADDVEARARFERELALGFSYAHMCAVAIDHEGEEDERA